MAEYKPKIDVQKEAYELGELLDEFEVVKKMPDLKEEFYPTNRAARRTAEKRNRALMKRKPRA